MCCGLLYGDIPVPHKKTSSEGLLEKVISFFVFYLAWAHGRMGLLLLQ